MPKILLSVIYNVILYRRVGLYGLGEFHFLGFVVWWFLVFTHHPSG